MSKSNLYIKEACVESLEQAISAEKNGADRIELCSHLELDGLTPSEELVGLVQEKLTIPIKVMIRPRAGDFIYSEEEIRKMIKSIEFCKSLEMEGVVFGALHEDKTLDLNLISKLAKIAKPLKVTIHKAIDETEDILKAVKDLSHIAEIDTILTSGGADTAEEGAFQIKQMIGISQNRLEIMPAGKITPANLKELHKIIGAKAYHGRRIV